MASPRSRIFGWMGVAALAATFFTHSVQAAPTDPLFSALKDSFKVQVADRRYDDAVASSRRLVAELDSHAVESTAPADLASGLEMLARSLRLSGKSRSEETLAIGRRAEALCRDHLEIDADVRASCFNTLGLIHFQRSDSEPALALFREATEIWREEHGSEDQRVATGLNNQGLVLEEIGRNVEAKEALKQAADIYRTRRDEPSYRTKLAQTTMALAKLDIKLGDYDEGLRRGESAVAIYREQAGPAGPRVGSALADLGALARTTGELDRAQQLYDQAIEILVAGYGPRHPEVGRILNNLGNVHADLGNIAAARDCFERALSITEEQEGPDAPRTGVRLLNLGSTLLELGDGQLALAHLRRAESIFQSRLGPDHLYMGYASEELGNALAALQGPDAGLPRLEAARAIFVAQLGSGHLAVAEIDNRLGEWATEMGRPEDAAVHLKRARSNVEEIFPTGHPLLIEILVNQARVARLGGDAATALALLADGTTLGRSLLGSDHPAMARLEHEKGLALHRLGRDSDALKSALTAEEISRRNFILAASAFEESRTLTLAERRLVGLDDGIAFCLSAQEKQGAGADVVALWEQIIRSRGLVQEIMARRRRESGDRLRGATSDLADSLRLAARDLAQLAIAGPGERAPAIYTADLNRARVRWDDLDRRLGTINRDHVSGSFLRTIDLDDVRGGLRRCEALVSYKIFSSEGREKGMVAVVLDSATAAPRLVDLGPVAVLEERVAAWLRDLERSTDTQASGRGVAHLVWDSLGLAPDLSSVAVVPDGVLNLIDFQTLPREEGGYLIDGAALVKLLGSERDLVKGPNPSSHRSLLVMGGADFGALPQENPAAHSTRAAPFEALRFAALPGSRQEAETVSDLWRSLAAGEVLCLTGAQASEAAFKKHAPRFDIAHLATHGFFLDRPGQEGAAATRGVGLVGPDTASATDSREPLNPLLLAGLAFAGANRDTIADGGEDGILTAYEVAAMDLDEMVLAVLSACRSGTGTIRDGEGIMGLRRAFATAGVPNLLMSLYPVRDDVASSWTRRFYAFFLQDQWGVHEAARAASRALLAERRRDHLSDHPAFWSPFVAVGPGVGGSSARVGQIDSPDPDR